MRKGPGRAFAAASLGVAVLVAGTGVAAGGSGGSPEKCGGRQVTIFGTDQADTVLGTQGRDVIAAGAGDDNVEGRGGSDLICGSGGDDRLTGASSPDRLFGGPGTDFLEGGTGSDVLRGEGGSDRIFAGRGNDVLAGGPGDGDLAAGELGDDLVRGGAGNDDEAAGGLGIDRVNGGPGREDLVSGDYGYDFMSGGPGGGDIASFASAVRGGSVSSKKEAGGVTVSLRRGRARGDGRDRLRRFESIEGSAFSDRLYGDRGANLIDGGPGDDLLRGGDGADVAEADTGIDSCRGFAETTSCGREPISRAPAFLQMDLSPAGGGGLAVIGGRRSDQLEISYDPIDETFEVLSRHPIGIGQDCDRVGDSMRSVLCEAEAPVRRMVVDLGPGDDRLLLGSGLATLGAVRGAGGPGDDLLRGGDAEDLLEAGTGADRLEGGDGSDGLIGGIPGPDLLFGGRGGDLMAPGSACIGGRLVGGLGRDNASFAETPGHPGVLYASLAIGEARVDAIEGCRPVIIDPSAEDLEGSFDWDILIGDAGANNIFGQPGRDRFFGRGGGDSIDARDGLRDFRISCGAGDDGVFLDRRDPSPQAC